MIISNTAIQFMEGFCAAWASQNPDQLLPYYSKAVEAFDAEDYGTTYHYSTVNHALSTYFKNGDFYVITNSFFITDDGHYSAVIGIFFEKDGDKYNSVPAMSLLEINGSQVIWEYDYYAGCISKKYPLPEIHISASETSVSENEITNLKSKLSNWVSANNGKDLDSISSYYAENASCITMIRPDWLVQTRSQMLNNLEKKFADENFNTFLENVFISPNGQYAAVQGEYKIDDKQPQPIIMLLEIENKVIVRQYLYVKNPIYEEFLTKLNSTNS